MFGFRFVKFQPSEYVLKVQNGKVVQEGVGLSFYYYEPTTSVVVVPVSSIDVPFMFEEITHDYQTVTVQGQLTYRIVDYRKTTQILNYTYHLKKKTYLSDDPNKLAQRIIHLVKVLIKKQLEQMPLKEAIQSSERLVARTIREVKESEEIEKLGIELMGLSVLAILPNKETMRALEAKAREEILRDADEALYERRNASIEQERRVKENELSTEIAIETKKKQIRETQLDAERLVKQKQNEMKEEQLHFDTALEEQKRALIELAVANKNAEADAKAYELAAIMKSINGTQPYVLQAMTNLGMEPSKLIAIAFQDIAEKAEKIGQLNITPDLLQGLLSGSEHLAMPGNKGGGGSR
ncbi:MULTISPECIES: SPFH domain-containing protein [Bacillales]|uniref:SPFH domain-containing protein n=1 Tax=Bacillales TaxID=1385 RepID=UPI0006A793D4|nr:MULTISPECIES: SPFH domain-containing protein [Bacillales]OBZ17485.1 membrane protease subunit, stomatin/prohibitin [Bacillus sp. FJAT-26390]